MYNTCMRKIGPLYTSLRCWVFNDSRSSECDVQEQHTCTDLSFNGKTVRSPEQIRQCKATRVLHKECAAA